MKSMIKDLLLMGFFAAFGGFIRTIVGKKREEKYNWKIAAGEIMIAIFTGILVHWLLKEFDVSDNIRTAAVALAGYSARGVLNVLNIVLLDRLKTFRFVFIFGSIIALSLIAGCRTEYYPDGKVKSEGFNLGTQGKGSYGLVVIQVGDDLSDLTQTGD